MKGTWGFEKLGDVIRKTEIIDPTKSPNKEFNYVDVSSVSNESFSIMTSSLIKGKDAPSRARKLIKTNDVVFATIRPTLKRIAIVPEELNNQICSTGYFVLRANERINHRLLFYFLQTDNFISKMEKLQRGASYPAVTDNDVKEQIISFPKSLDEQKRIVALLDKAFAAIDKAKANLQRNLQNSNELFQTAMHAVFAEKGEDWEEKRLDGLFQIKPPKDEARRKLNKNDVVSFLPMEDLNVLAHNVEAKRERKLEEVVDAYTYFSDNDVLLAKITPCFENGKIGVARNLKNGVGFGSSEYIVFRTTGTVIAEYLYYFLSRNQFREEGRKKMVGAVGHKRVSKEFIEGYQIPFPKSISTQQVIIEKLDTLSTETKKLQTLYQQKLQALDKLKKSILGKAFSGGLSGDALDSGDAP